MIAVRKRGCRCPDTEAVAAVFFEREETFDDNKDD